MDQPTDRETSPDVRDAGHGKIPADVAKHGRPTQHMMDDLSSLYTPLSRYREPVLDQTVSKTGSLYLGLLRSMCLSNAVVSFAIIACNSCTVVQLLQRVACNNCT